ncbi:MAG: hypothetical protein OXQ31_14075 [Spirochaetaceae bacterium]|nr:hypothetical protein [Spirochaetaceae bacterium]
MAVPEKPDQAGPQKPTAYIFHVLLKDGESLLLDPFRGVERLESTLAERTVEGRFGTEPRVEALTLYRNELYRAVDAAVRRWLSEKRFIPRFLASAGVFVLAMFVMAYVFRGGLPIPVIDELAIALGASVVAYLAIGRKELASEMATRKRVALKNAIDRITFVPSQFLVRVEEALRRYEAENLEGLVSEILDPADEPLDEPERTEATEFVRLLEDQFNYARLRKGERELKNFLAERGAERGTNLRKWAESQRLNFPLYAVYKRFKRTVERVR